MKDVSVSAMNMSKATKIVDNRTDDRTSCIYQIFHNLRLRRFMDFL